MRRDDTICSHSLGDGTLSLLEDLSGYRRDKRVMARAKSTRSGLARRSMSKRRSERVEVEGWLAGAADRIKNSVVDAMRDGRRQTGSHFRVSILEHASHQTMKFGPECMTLNRRQILYMLGRRSKRRHILCTLGPRSNRNCLKLFAPTVLPRRQESHQPTSSGDSHTSLPPLLLLKDGHYGADHSSLDAGFCQLPKSPIHRVFGICYGISSFVSPECHQPPPFLLTDVESVQETPGQRVKTMRRRNHSSSTPNRRSDQASRLRETDN
jgi:hypothetical protein